MKNQSIIRLQVVGKSFECGQEVSLVSINGEHPEPMTAAALNRTRTLNQRRINQKHSINRLQFLYWNAKNDRQRETLEIVLAAMEARKELQTA